MMFWRATFLIFAYFLGTNALAALMPDQEKEIFRFVQSSPAINGLRVQLELVDPNVTVPACLGGSIQISAQPGARIWGRTVLQLRCAKAGWMVNIPFNIRVFGNYVVASQYLPAGQKLEPGDIRVIEGELSTLPDDVLRTPKNAYDRVLSRSLQMGSPVGLNDLKESSVVKVGDPVRLVLKGKDFEVSGEGVAQTAGMIGDMVRVRLADGQVLQGRVLRPSVVVVMLE
ncbi:flagellar basal body P-ring formation chaperone FlgA [Polynucleobacter sp. MWH-UH35A]|uniref:flagellar basal body P-ring formation chaperone FlgA n=1 Tax=Polynucleobacter sp. MWH-UH35A TaxID=1855619 RepID=UPI001BFDF2DA|nr:flagellar basal body P-ring formation chaperone FlgA [Polynucleobacter sp. MWH-UH35A]QWD59764.1 flagellar basal body P-ring formation protein FlgA [Polynucleobacter sp. MWH-UH35A]